MKSQKLSRSKNKQYKKSTKHRNKKTPKLSKKKSRSQIKKNKRVNKRKQKRKEKKKVVTLMNGGGCKDCNTSTSENNKNSMKEYMDGLRESLNIQGGGGYTVSPLNNQHYADIIEYNDNDPPEIEELRK